VKQAKTEGVHIG